MVNILILIILVKVTISAAQTTTSKIDNKYGFRDLKLEASFSSINSKYQLQEGYSTDKLNAYYLKGLDMYIDDIPIQHILVDFIDGELYSIFLEIDCDKSTTKLTKLIEESYGKLSYNTESYDYFIKGSKAELIYQVKGEQLTNGYIKAFANLTIRSLKLKKKITGKNNGF